MKGLLILGMHRSGTSALAGQCAGLGLSFGNNLLPPQSDNPEGYYEDIELTAANDLLVTILLGGWDSPLAWADAAKVFPVDDPRVSEIASAAREVLRKKSQGMQHWAVKDPRFSRLLPIWWPMIRAMGLDVSIIMAVRRPSEVAASLEKRNGLGATTSQVLWLRHVAEPLIFALENEIKVGMVSYDILIQSPAHLSEVLEDMGFPISSQSGAEFVDGTLRHHRHEKSRSDDSITKACEQLYDFAVSIPVFSRETVSDADALMILAAQNVLLDSHYKQLYLEAKGLLPNVVAQRGTNDPPRRDHDRLTLAMTITELRQQYDNLKIKNDLLETQLESRTTAIKNYVEKARSLPSPVANDLLQDPPARNAPTNPAPDVVVKELASLQEFIDFKKERPDYFAADKIHAAAKRIAENGIYCNVYREIVPPEAVTIHDQNYRETITYKGLNSRLRAVHYVLAHATADVPDHDFRLYAPEAMTAYASFLRGTNTKFLGSEYTTDPRMRDWLYPIPHEDLHKLSFPDMAFRAAVVNEVFEHLPFLDKALGELARILMPGGKLVSMFPFGAASERSLVRAAMTENGQINYLLPPQYHGNPVDEKGSLVFEIPGWDILDRTRAAGFRTATMQWVYSESCGMLSPGYGGHFVLLAQK